MKVEEFCHAVNRALCEERGDLSCKSWDETDEQLKESTREGVKAAEYVDLPEEMHASWAKNRKENGWIYGEVKDLKKKEHPLLIPYEDLPYEAKVKDIVFLAIVRNFKYLNNQ